MDTASELLELAREKFGKLTEAEEKLFRAAAKGDIADYSPINKKSIDPANAAKWNPSRVLVADRIAWLCTDKQASQLVTHRGIRIKGARIDEEFNLEHAKVPFPLLFEKCKFTADLNFLHAHIVALYMPGTHISKLFAGGLRTTGSIYFRDNFTADGEVLLVGASVGGDLDCRNSQFTDKDGYAFSADGLKVEGAVFLNAGFRAEGEVCLLGARIRGDLDCASGEFVNRDGIALCADGLKVGQSVYLRNGFQAWGEVRLLGATIGGDFSCIRGQFINKKRRVLCADGLKIDGNVFLREGFKAEGIVSLAGATIGGNLDCRHGTFTNSNRVGLLGDNLMVKGDMCLCDGLRVECEISLVAARIDGLLHCTGLVSPEEMKLDLRYARIGTLRDEEKSWPGSGKLFLHGLVYKEIHNNAPMNANTRVSWIQRQGKFWAQPYEQLAKVLRESGDDAGARDVLVAKNKDKAKRSKTKLTFAEKCWYHFFGPLIGYGHKPWLAVPWALVIILFGSVFFKEGYSHGLVTPLSDSAYAKEGDAGILAPVDKNRRISEVYPVFNSLVYSIDVFIPVVDLRQAKHWLPNANRGPELVPTSSAALCTGGLLLFWLWLETACGWMLTTLFLVGLTGLVRT